MVVMSFASPIGVNRLLGYIETGGENATVHPWFWILWILLGPLLGSIATQYHTWILNCVTVRSSATITQLVFDHALRIRIKAETQNNGVSAQTTAVNTPRESQTEGSDATNVKDQSSTTSGGVSGSKGHEGTSGTNVIGRLNNLVTSDLNNINNGADVMMLIVYVPIQVTFCVVFLYFVLGWSALIGIGATFLCLPIPAYLSTIMSKAQKLRMTKTDARVQQVTETMSIIRMVKLFGWEAKMNDRIAKVREEEMEHTQKFRMSEILIGISGFAIPFVTTITAYGIFALVMKEDLTASKVFSSMVAFDMFRGQLFNLASRIPTTISAKVSLDRLNAFLYQTELLDEYSPDAVDHRRNPDIDPQSIGFKDVSFAWTSGSESATTPDSPRRIFTLKVDDELLFKRGKINLIVGPTGSGKTSMLMALLGELHCVPLGSESFFQLPREGGIAYASQESWVQNETLRDNILFGSLYEEERYNKVIEQCGLKPDLELFEAGDMTEVGEKGLTLSGGQKARVTLARAVYSRAEILLLDDVLAALDVHTSKWIAEKCFKGDLVRGRTVILVTHNIALMSSIAEFVVAMGRNGSISNQGSLSKVLAKEARLIAEIEAEETQIATKEEIADRNKLNEQKAPDGKLVVAEEVAHGRVAWPALKLYLGSLGDKHRIFWWVAFVFNMTFSPLLLSLAVWYLGYWASQYQEVPASEVPAAQYLLTYTGMVTFGVTVYAFGYLYYIIGAVIASKKIHRRLVSSILSSTMRWLDVTPTSRVINRCTQDITSVDDQIPVVLAQISEITAFMIVKFLSVLLIARAALIPGVLVAAASAVIGQIYLRAQLSIRREMSNAQSPIISHFGAAITGLVSIRAYGAQKATRQESFARIDKYTRTAQAFRDVNRWMSVRVEAIGALFAAGIAAYLVYGAEVSASNTGFALNMTVGFCELIRMFIFTANRIEVTANSLERIQQYLDIDHEPQSKPSGIPPAYWPSSGKLQVEKLSARYSSDGPQVLHDISFTISSGERVGIVGRTGSGKSSLTLSLLRCILTNGSVLLDGLPTGSLNLDALRSNITIIPQVPELLSGTLRQNLDPFDEYDDAVLHDSLRAAGLYSLQQHEGEARLTLDTAIASGGGNLSVGQRQILALARAMVRRSKLLILDEATSAIDNETDNAIQASLRNELDKDVTLLTVAHRLQTIMDADKIMVLDAGRIAEFGEPKDLLQKEEGVLRALVQESEDRDILYAMTRA
ncbi:hypothetical protein EIP91_009093 [Steccherinum ochraceum]|uniref:P-loop containing nucleoside triphosphate hydrolase protein n=1 Tax=Steccherinum ochraceum TaxID=92696 RepID=A0A4R0RK31_9APHY|nr:hypothetical protein EIP91_009093 [Steccherinum ochraceum]